MGAESDSQGLLVLGEVAQKAFEAVDYNLSLDSPSSAMDAVLSGPLRELFLVNVEDYYSQVSDEVIAEFCEDFPHIVEHLGLLSDDGEGAEEDGDDMS